VCVSVSDTHKRVCVCVCLAACLALAARHTCVCTRSLVRDDVRVIRTRSLSFSIALGLPSSLSLFSLSVKIIFKLRDQSLYLSRSLILTLSIYIYNSGTKNYPKLYRRLMFVILSSFSYLFSSLYTYHSQTQGPNFLSAADICARNCL
jgi:hypothetical protein